MTTTVGTSSDLSKLIENFIYLERDAIAAYDETISRLKTPAQRDKIAEFRADHQSHLDELIKLAAEHGAKVPAEGDMKQLLITGKVKLADLVGDDGAILKAMSSNENDTISAYASACSNEAVPAAARPFFERALLDEKRHQGWMDAAA